MQPATSSVAIEALKKILPARNRTTVSIEEFTRAAVLVPLIRSADRTDVLLTLRTHDVETHKGQVSFPGGVEDETDASIVATALRETQEELGINPDQVEVLGILDDLATPTGFVITPVVGALTRMPSIVSNPSEVAETFTVPLDFFRDASKGRSELREFRGAKREIWFYEMEGRTIWGATAMIMRSLIELLEPS
jgi:8-oxo-dGTP pyrophosphatase MutT (NUDIX family)